MSRKAFLAMFCAALLLVAGFITGCGSSSSGGGGNPAEFPTQADKYEGMTGDNTYLTATDFKVGQSRVANLWKYDDQDWIKVDLTSGVSYEFSASRISVNQDTRIYLYDTDGTTEIDNNDDCIAYDSCLTYTPTLTGTYYAYVTGSNHDNKTSYTLGVRVFVDNDADGWSNFYDCNDNDDTIWPANWLNMDTAIDIPGDGIDQDCDGVDTPLTTSLIAEPDDTWQTARELKPATGHILEMQYRIAETRANMRTIYNAPSDPDDVDYFRITVPAHSAYDIESDAINQSWDNGLSVHFTVYDTDGITVLATDQGQEIVQNDGDVAGTFYLKFYAVTPTDNGTYLPGARFLGYDMDADGYYSMESSSDCNDDDDTINPGATDTFGDGIDQNCNGVDG